MKKFALVLVFLSFFAVSFRPVSASITINIVSPLNQTYNVSTATVNISAQATVLLSCDPSSGLCGYGIAYVDWIKYVIDNGTWQNYCTNCDGVHDNLENNIPTQIAGPLTNDAHTIIASAEYNGSAVNTSLVFTINSTNEISTTTTSTSTTSETSTSTSTTSTSSETTTITTTTSSENTTTTTTVSGSSGIELTGYCILDNGTTVPCPNSTSTSTTTSTTSYSAPQQAAASGGSGGGGVYIPPTTTTNSILTTSSTIKNTQTTTTQSQTPSPTSTSTGTTQTQKNPITGFFTLTNPALIPTIALGIALVVGMGAYLWFGKKSLF